MVVFRGGNGESCLFELLFSLRECLGQLVDELRMADRKYVSTVNLYQAGIEGKFLYTTFLSRLECNLGQGGWLSSPLTMGARKGEVQVLLVCWASWICKQVLSGFEITHI